MPKTSKELWEEVAVMEATLKRVCSNGDLIYLDLMFVAQRLNDIKQELRLAETRGE